MLRRTVPPILAILLVMIIWIANDWAVPVPFASWSGRLQGLATVFLGIFIEALPFLMAGVLVSSAIHLFVTPADLRRLTPRTPLLAALFGALLGLAFPVCECGSIPATRRLLAKGGALPMAIAFALAAPVINPIVLIATLIAFGSWQMVAWRAGLTIVIAVLIALVVGVTSRRELLLAPGVVEEQEHALCDHEQHQHHVALPTRGSLLQNAEHVLIHARGELFEMMRYLIAGAMLAALLQTLVPQQPLLLLGEDRTVSVVVLMLLALILSVCSTVDSFIALSFAATFTPGAVVAFLVFGPMIDIKSTLMLTTTFNRRTVAIMALLCAQLSLLAGIAVNMLFS